MCVKTLATIKLLAYDSLLPNRQLHLTLLVMDLHETIKLFWRGKAFLLALGLAITVATVPFLIALLTLVIFFCPLTFRRREWLFHCLMWGAKWQLMNALMSVYVLAALEVNVDVADVFVLVQARPGLGGNLCIWTPNLLIIFTLIAFFHHQKQMAPSTTTMKTSRFIRNMQLTLIAFSSVFLYIVYQRKMIKFELSGLATVVLPPDQKLRHVSIVDEYNLVPDLFPTNMCFLWNVFIAPIAAHIFTIGHLFAGGSSQLFSACSQIFTAFEGLEVLLGINIAVAIEIGELSKFLIDYKFPKLCEKQSEFTHVPCMRSDGTMLEGTWWLLACLLCYFGVFAIPLFKLCTRFRRQSLVTNEMNGY